jgi:hypothetical protein
MFDWKNWAQNVLKLPVEWGDFYITNSLVLVVGIVAVKIAPEYPAVALGLPALMLINATFFHVFPFVLKRGRFSPGLVTALLLFFPLGIYTMQAAEPSAGVVATAFVVGAALMAMPIVFLKVKGRTYFDQTRPV